jgi:hypothetical protein
VRNQRRRETQLSNEAETTVDTTLTLGTLWPDIRATHPFTARASRTLLKITFNETQPPCLAAVLK